MTARSLRRALPRLAALTVAAGAALTFGVAGVASAHVDADPAAVEHGTTAEVAFAIEHGCEESPTTGMELRFPDGFTGLEGVEKEGWTSSVSGQVVTFTGGSVPHDEVSSFAVKVTAPEKAGTYYVPVVQSCEEGVLRWIEIPEEGKAEPESPAVMVKVTEGAPTAEDMAHEEGAAAGEEDASHSAGSGEPVTVTNVDAGNTAYVVVGVVGAIVLVGLAAAVASDRKRDAVAGDAHH